MEFIAKTFDVYFWEEYCQELVAQKKATLIKDTTQSNGLGVKVYLINVGEQTALTVTKAQVRFWYDKRVDRAGIKITRDALRMLFRSVTATALLKQLQYKIDPKKPVDIDIVSELLREAIKRKDKEREPELEVIKDDA